MQKSAEIIAFPLARRLGLIRRQAAWFGRQVDIAAEQNLRWQVERQRQALVRKGVHPATAAAEAAQFEAAVRAQVIRAFVTGTGRA